MTEHFGTRCDFGSSLARLFVRVWAKYHEFSGTCTADSEHRDFRCDRDRSVCELGIEIETFVSLVCSFSRPELTLERRASVEIERDHNRITGRSD